MLLVSSRPCKEKFHRVSFPVCLFLCLDSSEDSDDSEIDFGDEQGADEEETPEVETDVRVLDWQPTGLDCALGEWEKHTTVSGQSFCFCA